MSKPTLRQALFRILLPLTLLQGVSGCAGLTPNRPVPSDGAAAPFKAPTFLPTLTPEPVKTTSPDANAQNPDCTNSLSFLEDLSLPDGTQVKPAKSLEKQWQVRNTGTCNWDENYTIQLISGELIGAESPQALVPARNGTDAVISIRLSAPIEPGRYKGTWQAFGPDGQPFGDWFSVEIVVIAP